MDTLVELIKEKTEAIGVEVMEVSELRRKGVICAETARAFEQGDCRRRRRKNVLKWWLGWENHRQLVKVLRKVRMTVRNQPTVEVDAAVDFLQFDEEVPNRMGDVITDVLIDDDDLSVELSEASNEPQQPPVEVEERKTECVEVLPNSVNDEEFDLIRFFKNQSERMQMMRDRLLAMPDDPELYVPPEEIFSIPPTLRWLLFAR